MAPVVIASEEVANALDELAGHWSAFLEAANSISDGTDRAETRRELEEHRRGFREKLAKVQRSIRADLRR